MFILCCESTLNNVSPTGNYPQRNVLHDTNASILFDTRNAYLSTVDRFAISKVVESREREAYFWPSLYMYVRWHLPQYWRSKCWAMKMPAPHSSLGHSRRMRFTLSEP